MPTYQYACTACQHQLEAVQSFTDDPLTQCPVCDGRLRKLFGSVGIVFKGPGFYRTDSRSASNGNGKGSGKGSDSGGGANGNGDGASKSSTDGASSGSTASKDTGGDSTKKATAGASSPASS